MKLKDLLLNDIIELSETPRIEFSLIVEDLSGEINKISNKTIINPYDKFKSQQITDFAKELKQWAIRTLHRKIPTEGKTKKNEKFFKLLNKIIEKPKETAKQLFTTIMYKKANDDKKPKNDNTVKLWDEQIKY